MMRTTKIANAGTITLRTDKLDAIQRQLAKQIILQIGVLGSATERPEQKPGESHDAYAVRAKNIKKAIAESGTAYMNNATIGLIHEKGSKSRNIARRSFLEMPLMTRFAPWVRKEAKKLEEGLTEDNVILTIKKFGVKAVGFVQEAFHTKGFNTWYQNPKTGRGSLVDTAQLRKSISFRVITK